MFVKFGVCWFEAWHRKYVEAVGARTQGTFLSGYCLDLKIHPWWENQKGLQNWE
jgi:hypothetical protein